MSQARSLLRPALIGGVALALAACGRGEEGAGESAPAGAASSEARYRYNREFIFVAPAGEATLVAPFTFRTVDLGESFQRNAQAWLARGATWDRFLDASSTTSTVGGVWRVVPHAELRVMAGGPIEIEALRYQRGERRLRLDLDAPLTGWTEGGDTRFRLLSGAVAIGTESVPGTIFEVLRVEPFLEDGWPPDSEFDDMYLVSGDSLQILLADAAGPRGEGPGYGWLRRGGIERSLNAAEIRWLELRSLQDARRDIPRRWSFAIPGTTMVGELEAIGSDALLGPERGGRRATEVRFTVEGWLLFEPDGEPIEVRGMVRHTQG